MAKESDSCFCSLSFWKAVIVGCPPALFSLLRNICYLDSPSSPSCHTQDRKQGIRYREVPLGTHFFFKSYKIVRLWLKNADWDSWNWGEKEHMLRLFFFYQNKVIRAKWKESLSSWVNKAEGCKGHWGAGTGHRHRKLPVGLKAPSLGDISVSSHAFWFRLQSINVELHVLI